MSKKAMHSWRFGCLSKRDSPWFIGGGMCYAPLAHLLLSVRAHRKTQPIVYQNTLHFLNAHIPIFHHSSIEHPCGHLPPATLLLQCLEALQDDTFTVRQPITNIRQIVT